MAIIEALFVELDHCAVDSEVEIANFASSVAGEANTIERSVVLWVEIAVKVHADRVAVPFLAGFERDDGIFTAANGDDVTMEFVAEIEGLLFGWCWCFNSHEFFVWHQEIVDIHKLAETVVELFFEEFFLVFVESATLNREFWRKTQLVVANCVDNAKIEEQFVQEVVVEPLIADAGERDFSAWREGVFAEFVNKSRTDAGSEAFDTKRLKNKIIILVANCEFVHMFILAQRIDF